MYGKLTTNNHIQRQGNPVSVTISNPTDEQRAYIAPLRGELPIVETAQPQYDPETQWIEETGRIDGDSIVQVWTVHEIEDEYVTEEEG